MPNKKANRRSSIFYSALQPERLDDAIASGTDIAVFDLEDGTAVHRKQEGREAVRAVFERDPGRPLLKYLRINNPRTADGMRDVVTVLDWKTPPDGLVLPKVEQPEEVQWVADVVGEVHPDIELMLIMESPMGLERVYELASASPRIASVLLGCADFSGAMGCDRSWESLAYARGRVVAACAEAGIDAMDGPFFNNADEAGLLEEVRKVAAMGFTGKGSYDAIQIPHIHAAFTPSSEQIDHARRVLEVVGNDKLGVARLDGIMVNESIAKGARRLLAIAERRGVLHDAH